MEGHLIGDILAASQPLRLPGLGEHRVLTATAVDRLAKSAAVPLWELEAVALESGVVPLQYLRNLARFGVEGQIPLLRARALLVGGGPVAIQAAEELSAAGLGRLSLLRLEGTPGMAGTDGDPFTKRVRGRNASAEAVLGSIALRSGNPAGLLWGAGAVVSTLEDSASEQLLQMACRMAGAPLVVAGVQEQRGQLTTVLPGDPGVALLYKPHRPHLEPNRAGTPAEERAVTMVASWIVEQVTALITGRGDVMQGRLLYADLAAGEISEYRL